MEKRENNTVRTQTIKKKENKYLLKGGLYRPWAQARQKASLQNKRKSIKVDIRRPEMSAGVQASVGGTDGEDGEWAIAGVPGS